MKKTNISLDATPFLVELFKIHAQNQALATALLNKEQKEVFNGEYPRALKEVISTFLQQYPHLVSDSDELRDALK